MSLVINHNMMAMNATRNLNETYGRLATSTRRLSSGLRVGTAADDAAGLAMRELMRADIDTLGQGLRNANDGISMIQTADGALQVIDAKLIRMKELAEQAATGTYTDVQRQMINDEYQEMAKEITRIANDTDFNSLKLLEGCRAAVTTTEGSTIAGAGSTIDHAAGTMEAANTGDDATFVRNASNGLTVTTIADVAFTGPSDGTATFATNSDGTVTSTPLNGATVTDTYRVSKDYPLESDTGAAPDSTVIQTSTDGGKTWGPARDINDVTADIDGAGTIFKVTSTFGDKEVVDTFASDNFQFVAATKTIQQDAAGTKAQFDAAVESYTSKAGLSVNIHFGSGNVENNDSYDAWMGGATAKDLGVGDDANDNLKTAENAKKALENITAAIRVKDDIRAGLGATQNRLSATIENVSIQRENLQASESRISDVDVASEMTEFTRNQVMSQAAVSMLAQANSLPKMAQKLLDG